MKRYKNQMRSKDLIFLILMLLTLFLYSNTWAASSSSDQKKIAREFLSRIEKGFEQADNFMEKKGILEQRLDLRGLPDGEALLFEIQIPPRLELQDVIFGEIRNDTVLLSLRDIIRVLNFPIEYNAEAQTFSGWFLKEENVFDYNILQGDIIAAQESYAPSPLTKVTDEDVLVALSDAEQWFNMKIDVDISTQKLALDPEHPFPATLSHERRQKSFTRSRNEPPELPLKENNYKWAGMPVVDVNTRTAYKDRGGRETDFNNQINIRTAGDFAKGALLTNSIINDEEGLFSARITYLRESKRPELLGPLGARRFEAGDLTPTRLSITGSSGPETGVRITNTDPLVRLTHPSTRIEGYYYPNWDIELYRDNSLISFQETDEEGYYSFEDVPLFSDRNYFRIVAYGPQGEVREEVLSIPYDRNQLAKTGGVYDLSLTFQDRQAYQKTVPLDEDRNTPHVVGFYEIPILEQSALRIGGRYREEEGQSKLYASAALSTSFKEALINAEIASDEEGEVKTELSATRQFGPHRTRVDLNMATKGYTPNDSAVNKLSNRYSIEGPLGLNLGINPRYNANFNYTIDDNNSHSTNGSIGFNTQLNRIGINQRINYRDSENNSNGANIGGTTSVSGTYGRNIFRSLARYDFRPEADLTALTAFWRRQLTPELNGIFSIEHSFDDTEDITDYSAQLNWRIDEAVITPRISYDSNGDIEALLSTRFSTAKESVTGDVIFTRNSLTTFGTLSAFVYLDKNGNYAFDEEDEPVEGARIITPQNSRGGFTNKEGVAYIDRLRPTLITDVYLQDSSLSDPFWISAKDGHSVMPRRGSNMYMEFPVHISGEIDGTVYKRFMNGKSAPAVNVRLGLYNRFGELEQETTSGPDGFYLFSLVPPGKYYLTVMNSGVSDFGRPPPMEVQIGYDGTIIYGQDLFLKEGSVDVAVNIMPVKEKENVVEKQVALNLGRYNSPLMATYIWRKLLNTASYYLGGGELLSDPEDQNIIRVALPENTITSGYQRCSGIVSKGQFCEVEVFLAGTEE